MTKIKRRAPACSVWLSPLTLKPPVGTTMSFKILKYRLSTWRNAALAKKRLSSTLEIRAEKRARCVDDVLA